jgi:hypothetical protein
LTRWQAQRRAALKAEGARRIEVTLRGEALDQYAIIGLYLGTRCNQAVILKALDIAAARILAEGASVLPPAPSGAIPRQAQLSRRP